MGRGEMYITYTVFVKDAPTPDLAQKIAEAHAEALKSAQRRRKRLANEIPPIQLDRRHLVSSDPKSMTQALDGERKSTKARIVD